MKLDEIRQSYDAIISLGVNCQVAYQLNRLKLRKFIGPLEWIGTPSLTNLNLLIKNDFSGFMDFENLKVVDTTGDNHYRVWDMENNVISIHDFPLDKPIETSYQVNKLKFDRQIKRYLEQINSGNKILFVRLIGHRQGVMQLHSALSEKVKGPFAILLINYHDENQLVEEEWGLDNICSVKIPNDPNRWEGLDEWWSEIFKGITLTEK